MASDNTFPSLMRMPRVRLGLGVWWDVTSEMLRALCHTCPLRD